MEKDSPPPPLEKILGVPLPELVGNNWLIRDFLFHSILISRKLAAGSLNFLLIIRLIRCRYFY